MPYRYKIAAAFFMMCFFCSGWVFSQEADMFANQGNGSYQLEMEEIGGGSAETLKEQGSRMSMEEKKRIRQRYERFKNLPLEQQEYLKKKWRSFKNLSLEEQEKIRKRHERFMNMTPEEREKILRRRERWQKLTPEEKEARKEKRRMKRQADPDKRKKREMLEGKKNGETAVDAQNIKDKNE